MYLLQIWFNLSDPATENAIYDSYAMRKFTGIDFMTETVPDETTLCKFRHLLEETDLNKLFFDAIIQVMLQTVHMMKGGTIVDATIPQAPSSTKNAEKARNPEMHQTKKGNEWKFGMKCHIGVDAGSGLVHTMTVTAANTHDITQAAALIREDDMVAILHRNCLNLAQKRLIHRMRTELTRFIQRFPSNSGGYIALSIVSHALPYVESVRQRFAKSVG